jgi:hypothetical protein
MPQRHRHDTEGLVASVSVGGTRAPWRSQPLSRAIANNISVMAMSTNSAEVSICLPPFHCTLAPLTSIFHST